MHTDLGCRERPNLRYGLRAGRGFLMVSAPAVKTPRVTAACSIQVRSTSTARQSNCFRRGACGRCIIFACNRLSNRTCHCTHPSENNRIRDRACRNFLMDRKWPDPAAGRPGGSVLRRWIVAPPAAAGRCPLPAILSMPSPHQSGTASRVHRALRSDGPVTGHGARRPLSSPPGVTASRARPMT